MERQPPHLGLFAGTIRLNNSLGSSVGLYARPGQAEKDMLGYDAAGAKLPLCGLTQEPDLCFKTGETPKYAIIGDGHADHLFVGLAETGSR